MEMWTLVASFLLFTGHTVDVEVNKFENEKDCRSTIEFVMSFNNRYGIYNVGEFECVTTQSTLKSEEPKIEAY